MLAAPASAAAEAPRPLVVDRARSTLVAVTERAGWLAFLGHRHAIVATDYAAEIVLAGDDLRRSRVRIRVPLGALRIDSRAALAAAGLASGPDEETVRKLQAKMLSAEVLDANRYPAIEFGSEAVEVVDKQTLRIRGPLRLHGRERPVVVGVRVERLGDKAYRFAGEFEVRQTDFGIAPESVAGVVRVADPVTIRFDLVARPAAD